MAFVLQIEFKSEGLDSFIATNHQAPGGLRADEENIGTYGRRTSARPVSLSCIGERTGSGLLQKLWQENVSIRLLGLPG